MVISPSPMLAVKVNFGGKMAWLRVAGVDLSELNVVVAVRSPKQMTDGG